MNNNGSIYIKKHIKGQLLHLCNALKWCNSKNIIKNHTSMRNVWFPSGSQKISSAGNSAFKSVYMLKNEQKQANARALNYFDHIQELSLIRRAAIVLA